MAVCLATWSLCALVPELAVAQARRPELEVSAGVGGRGPEPPVVAYTFPVTLRFWSTGLFGGLLSPRYQRHGCDEFDAASEPDHWIVRAGASVVAPRLATGTGVRLVVDGGILWGFATATGTRASCRPTASDRTVVHHDLGAFGSVSGELLVDWFVVGLQLDVEYRGALGDERERVPKEGFSVGAALAIGGRFAL